MTEFDKQKLGKTLWNIADQLRGAMNADDFRDYMLAFLFLRYLSDNYEAAAQKNWGQTILNRKKGSVILHWLCGMSKMSRMFLSLRN